MTREEFHKMILQEFPFCVSSGRDHGFCMEWLLDHHGDPQINDPREMYYGSGLVWSNHGAYTWSKKNDDDWGYYFRDEETAILAKLAIG